MLKNNILIVSFKLTFAFYAVIPKQGQNVFYKVHKQVLKQFDNAHTKFGMCFYLNNSNFSRIYYLVILTALSN